MLKVSIPRLVLLIMLSGSLFSCDPSQEIWIENRTEATATVKFIFSNPDGYYDFDPTSSSDTLLIELDTTVRFKEYLFGIGGWEINGALDTLAETLNQIEITSWKATQVFRGDEQIKNFLKENMEGKYGQSIKIIIE